MNVYAPMIGFGIAIWIVGIPIALGFFLRGWWPKTRDEFLESPGGPWISGVLWPLELLVLFVRLVLRALWFVVTLIVRGLFRLGNWLES
ncbi:MAG: hypothetical protein K940chlam2_01812 [Chlamydiae bacterium]|nr:hypothetical protein [Chlamydiota bacterium]